MAMELRLAKKPLNEADDGNNSGGEADLWCEKNAFDDAMPREKW